MLETLEATRHLQSTLLPSRRRVLAPPQKRPRLQGRPSISTLPDVGCLPRVRAPPPPNVRCAAAYVPQAPSKPVPSTELEVLDGAAAPASPPCHAAHDHHAHAHAHGHHATATHHQHSPTPTTLRLAAVPLSHTSAAASLPASTAAAAAAPQTHNPLSSTTTAATLSSLDLLTQSLDATSTFETDTEDGEMCTLVQTDHGDVQMVCDSDPTHPISTAEVAALNPIVPATLLQVRARTGLLHSAQALARRRVPCDAWRLEAAAGPHCSPCL